MSSDAAADAVQLTVQVSHPETGLAVVVIGGELDVDTATELHYQLANQIHHGRRHLVLDLAGVPFMDSSGLNIIIRAQQETRRQQGSLRLAGPTHAVRRILDLTGVSITTPIHATVEEAVAAERAEGGAGSRPVPGEEPRGGRPEPTAPAGG